MKRMQSWILWMLLVSMMVVVWPVARTQAAESSWLDLPNDLFNRMACFDGANAEVLWATDGNAYLWKTSTRLTNYEIPSNRSFSAKWCSDDGWFYSTEMSLVYSNATASYEYTNIQLQRRSLTQAPVVVANLSDAITSYNTDITGKMSIVTPNKQQINVLQSANGASWQSHSYTFSEQIVDTFIATHSASHIYAITMPKTSYADNEVPPSERTISHITIWKSTNAGQSWRTQSRIILPRSCKIHTYTRGGTSTAFDPNTCYSIDLNVKFLPASTRYTSPDALALKITYAQNGLLTGKTMFSITSGQRWQDVQQIQGSSATMFRSFFNDSLYPGSMSRQAPELVYSPSQIFFNTYLTQHLNSTHGYDPYMTSINRASSMQTNNNRTWAPTSLSLATACDGVNAVDGSSVIVVNSMPDVRVCKSAAGIAYFDKGAWQWRQISEDNPYARLITVSNTLPLTIVRQRCAPSPMYGQFPTLDCTNMQYIQVNPTKAISQQVAITTPLAVPFERATKHTIEPRFLRYWRQNGGLAQYGYPISEPFYTVTREGKRVLVQYFERNRFEWHPANAGTTHEVQLGLLGVHYGAIAQQQQPGPFARQSGSTEQGQLFFAETGHTLRNSFKRHWLNTGGLAQYGYPISEEFYEVNPVDGQTYVVQYFERARFEWHPEHVGTQYEVLLGLLGTQLLAESGY